MNSKLFTSLLFFSVLFCSSADMNAMAGNDTNGSFLSGLFFIKNIFSYFGNQNEESMQEERKDLSYKPKTETGRELLDVLNGKKPKKRQSSESGRRRMLAILDN